MKTLRWILFIPSALLFGALAGAILAAMQALLDGTLSLHGYGWHWGVGAWGGVTVGAFVAPSESKLTPAAILVVTHFLLCGFAIWSDRTFGDGKRLLDYIFVAAGAICGWGQFLTAKGKSISAES